MKFQIYLTTFLFFLAKTSYAQEDTLFNPWYRPVDWKTFETVPYSEVEKQQVLLKIIDTPNVEMILDRSKNYYKDFNHLHFGDMTGDGLIDMIYEGQGNAPDNDVFILYENTGKSFKPKLKLPGKLTELWKRSEEGTLPYFFTLHEYPCCNLLFHRLTTYMPRTLKEGVTFKIYSETGYYVYSDFPETKDSFISIRVKQNSIILSCCAGTNPDNYRIAELSVGSTGFKISKTMVEGEEWSFVSIADSPKPLFQNIYRNPENENKFYLAGWVQSKFLEN